MEAIYEQFWKQEEAKVTEIFLQKQSNKKVLAQQQQQDIRELKDSVDLNNENLHRKIAVICVRGRNDIC
jgi:hypothetical protein